MYNDTNGSCKLPFFTSHNVHYINFRRIKLMKKYFFKQLYDFKIELNELSLDNNNVDLLLKIQQRLLSWHKSLEDFSHRRKKRLNYLSKQKKDPNNSKLISKQIKKSIKICVDQLYELKVFKLWARHLGNSIPHLYYDKGDLRAYSYSVNSINLKELSGDLFGKEGQDLELEIFYKLLSEGYKTLLNDLTSLIRHADIMVMEREVPFLMEVKQSKATSKTAERQIQDANKIGEYLLKDNSTEIRGGAISKRISASVKEISNKYLINKNFENSKKDGYCFSKIEDGFYCLSHLSGVEPSQINFSLIENLEKPFFFLLNQFKNQEDHSLFYPYSLSIDDPDIFANFLCGNFLIYFIIDWKIIEDKAELEKLTLTPISEFLALEILSDSSQPLYSYTLMKAIVEFTSVHWALNELCNTYASVPLEFKNLE